MKRPTHDRSARQAHNLRRSGVSVRAEQLETRILFSAAGAAPLTSKPPPPGVASVYLSGTDWAATLKERLQAQSIGYAPLGYWVPSHAAQLAVVPWANVTQLRLSFSGIMQI